MSRTSERLKLSKTTVESLPAPERGEALYWDRDLSGFGVRITRTARSYVVQARVKGTGTSRRVTIGRHGVITCEQARKMAQVEMGLMAGGTDPVATRKREKLLDTTLEDVVGAFLADRRNLKERTRDDYRRHLRTTFAAWKDRPVIEITRDKVLRLFREKSRTAPAQANCAMRYLKAWINYARGAYRTPDDKPIITENPVGVLSDTRTWNATRARTNHIPVEKIGRWWHELDKLRSDDFLPVASRSAADLVALLLLTGLRLDEAASLKWSQVDLDDKSLHLVDTKSRRDIRLPLSDLAAELLKARKNAREWIFPARSGPGHLQETRWTMMKLEAATGVSVTNHDLRRTFRKIAGELRIELWRAKALMNHAQNQDVTLKHYTDLSDVRYLRNEVNAIAGWIAEQSKIFAADNVVPLREVAA